MPIWPSVEVGVDKRVSELFAAECGVKPAQVASAPATYPLLGEFVDHYGGTAVIGLASQRAAVAISDASGETFEVVLHRADGSVERASVTQTRIAELAAEQIPGVDDLGRPTIAPTPPGGLAERIAGIVHTLVHRQLLSRDVTGLKVVIFSEIAPGGLGEAEAIDAALALALQAQAPDVDDAPMRARLAEVCAQSADLFVAEPVLKARYTAALRGQAGQLAVIDYADGSVTQAAVPATSEVLVSAAVPEQKAHDSGELKRRRFLDEACRAFGATSLRALPDASTRVIDWLKAVHKVHPEQDAPTVEQAQGWLDYFEAETERAREASLLLRSRRTTELGRVLRASQSVTADLTGHPTGLVELLLSRGANTARSVGASAAWAYVPATHAQNFVADLAADGLVCCSLANGEVACLH